MKIYDDEIEINVERWKNTPVGYVVGNKPHASRLKIAVLIPQKLNSIMQIFSIGKSYFFFQLSNGEEYDRILQKGHGFDGRLIVIKK